MPTAKSTMSVTVLSGCIYAIGGDPNGRGVERYNPAENTWMSVAPMNKARINPSVATLNDKIYVIDDDHFLMNSVECYDPEMNKWTTVLYFLFVQNYGSVTPLRLIK